MARTGVRVGSSRGTARRGEAPKAYPDAMSGYGQTRADSVGYSPRNPYAYMGTQAAKAYRPSGQITVEDLLKKVTK